MNDFLIPKKVKGDVHVQYFPGRLRSGNCETPSRLRHYRSDQLDHDSCALGQWQRGRLPHVPALPTAAGLESHTYVLLNCQDCNTDMISTLLTLSRKLLRNIL